MPDKSVAWGIFEVVLGIGLVIAVILLTSKKEPPPAEPPVKKKSVPSTAPLSGYLCGNPAFPKAAVT